MAPDTGRYERRFVKSEDPSLSDEANQLLTDELQAAVGASQVEVPVDTVHREREEHATGLPERGSLVNARLVLVVSFAVMVTVGVIASLATGTWLALVAALAVHAVGTLVVAGSALQLTTEVEHVSPDVAARLEEEGVADPDRVLTDLVEEYAGAQDAHGLAEVISSGHNSRTARPEDDPARSTVEQESALTPASVASQPVGPGREIAILPAYVVGAMVVVSFVVAAMLGGVWWVVPGLVTLVAAGWLTVMLTMNGQEAGAAQGEPEPDGPDRRPGEIAAGFSRRLLPIFATVVLGVIGFGILIGVLIGRL